MQLKLCQHGLNIGRSVCDRPFREILGLFEKQAGTLWIAFKKPGESR